MCWEWDFDRERRVYAHDALGQLGTTYDALVMRRTSEEF